MRGKGDPLQERPQRAVLCKWVYREKDMRRWTAVFTAFLLLFGLSFPTAAQEGTPGIRPPSLYSDAAVLMDADTGQVIYGKNKDTTMYPASLTKVMTCLLAMEKGDSADLVTATAEAIDTVPRSTTHIALTYGEQLTLEQLTYAMMVESANDAANAVAIHLAGSIQAFAGWMNDKAKEIGAVNTHFTNANGLPDPGHYTTAYDLGLITKAAMEYPQFRQLAGTEYYEIPPTNLQPETRKLNNRQYMFCLNDTYPGAFAGKTGWTEEAGKTLITIAERDGVTLICVVLRASGTVDAEFKDSTALLDYGYDNFKRVTLPKEELPGVQDSQGEFAAQTDAQILLPDAVSREDLKMDVDDAHILRITAPDSAKAFMDTNVAAIQLEKIMPAVETSVPAEEEAQEPQWQERLGQVAEWLKRIMWPAGAAVGAVFLLLMVLRACLRAKYWRRNGRRKGATYKKRVNVDEKHSYKIRVRMRK